jgi:hypothetical protein
MLIQRALVVLLVLMFLSFGSASARDVLQGDQCRVPVRQTIDGDLFVLCRTLEIDGVVEGNVIGAATTAQINGRVTGNLYLLAGEMTLSGEVGESVHFAGPALRIAPEAQLSAPGADVLSVSLSTVLDAQAQVPDSVIAVGYQLVINGAVDGEVNFWGSALNITGSIARDVNATVGNSESTGVAELQTLLTFLPVDVNLERPGLRVAESAQIDGVLSYSAPAPGIIEASLAQQTVFTEIATQPDLTQIADIVQTADAGRELGIYLGQVLREFLSLFLVGGLVLLFSPNGFTAPLRNLSTRPLPSVGFGLLTFVVSFPLLAILVFSSVLIIVALGLLQLGDLTVASTVVLGVINLALGVFFYFVAIFVSRALVSLGSGRILLRLLRPGSTLRHSAPIQLAVGSLILAVVFSLPVVGWLLSAVAAFLGLGALLNDLQGQIEARRRPQVVRPGGQIALPSRSAEARNYPPPMLDGGQKAPGMDNLPAGFRWWED